MGAELATFFLLALLVTITPGVDTVLVLRNGVARGTAAGLATATGISSGLLVHALLSSVGLAFILSQSATAYHAVRLGGAAYLLWLGARILWRSFGTADEADEFMPPPAGAAGPGRKVSGRGFPASFAEGLLNNLLNPKVVLFYLAVVPQFVSDGGSIVATSVLLGGVHAIMAMSWLGLVAMAAGRARRWLCREAVRAWLDRCAGAVLLAFGARVAAGE